MNQEELDPFCVASLALGALSIPLGFIIVGALPAAAGIGLGVWRQKEGAEGNNLKMARGGVFLGAMGMLISLLVLAIGIGANV